ncbi:alpha/beta hydrolase [Arthrobacter sp. CAU 1506]|uniref:alpha/beta fold hydrolase n=1 Tax=Arthrobacter sp. CAU 1506 TaxID=2560052 RepID=UPI0010ABCC0D|nr:alpha/beta hydrolase [Arthrobacter sp. CAU 1506]TJY69758.1 alpha/beta hydrolase [Arthrobacter sp. CAU 1506]
MPHPIVLLHGWACSAAYWKPLADRLSASGRQVVAADLPGYGSDLCAGYDWTVENAAATLAEQTGDWPVHWVGHSLGGSIAATIAARFPRTTASLTLVGMVPVAPSPATVDKLARLFGGESSDPEADLAAGEELIGAWFRGGNEPQGEDRETFLAPFRRRPAVVRQSLPGGVTGAAPDVAELVSAPTLVVTGSRDATRPPAAVAEFLARHPTWRHASVPDAGHMVHWEQPAACAEAILRHIESAENANVRAASPDESRAGPPA